MPKAKNAANKISSKSKTTGSAKKSLVKQKGKNAPAKGGIKGNEIKRRFKPGTVALREIKKYQKSYDTLLPKAPFHRLVRHICGDIDHDLRF